MTAIESRWVEVCVFKFRGDHPEYLILRRASDDPLYPGIWQLVTGTVETGERALQASLRELREETGAIPERFWIAPFTNAVFDPRRDAVSLIPFFAAQVGSDFEPHLSPEHAAHAWLPFAQARTRLAWPGQRNGLSIVHQSIVAGEDAARLTAVDL